MSRGVVDGCFRRRDTDMASTDGPADEIIGGDFAPEAPTRQPGLSRRRLLGSFGAGAAGLAVSAAFPSRAAAAVAAGRTAEASKSDGERGADPTSFSRMFSLPSFAAQTPELVAALLELGRPGGILDANDPLDRTPKDLIVDLTLSANNANNPNHTAGTTFLGQFLDHDMTFDASSKMGVAVDPTRIRNVRTPSLDLDSVYGLGPVAQQSLYDATDHIKFRLESGGAFEDVPRRSDLTPIIADPRNDSTLITCGLHCAFLKFHNAVVDRVRASGLSDPSDTFEAARAMVLQHYHWIIVHEFLPQIVGQTLVDDVIARGAKFYRPRRDQASIPVEFQGAAYRFGHSMIRPSYRANLAGDNGSPFFALVFKPSEEGKADPDDMRGGARAPRRFVGWQTFFDFGDGQVKPSKKIDTKVSTPMFALPLGVIASHDAPTALVQRTLMRHLTWQLPSGQAIARAMRETALGPQDLAELAPLGQGLDRSTPLFYYVLKEAELVAEGLHLGPVGGRIVAEVFLGLLRAEATSYLSTQPQWRPTLPSRVAGEFGMVDLLRIAGVDPVSRGQ